MATILITGARAPVALEMARSFQAKGHTVIMADSIRFALARWSNTVYRYYHLPSPAHDFKGFQKKLKEILTKEKIDHFIPTCEETFYVSMCENLPEHCKIWTSAIELLNTLHNKLTFISLVSRYFPVPGTIRCDEFKDWNNATDFVFKPIYSRFAATTIIAKHESFCGEPKKNPDKWIAQEYLKGKEISVYSIWDKGILKAYTCYHSKYRAGKGAGIFFETVWHEATFAAVKKLGEDLQFTGQLSFDLILKDNQPYMLECNPRATSGAHMLNTGLADAFLEKEVMVLKEAPVFMIRFALLLTNPTIVLKKEWYHGIDVLFKRNDIKPALLQLISLVEIFYTKFKYKITLLQATTEDIEWNGNYDQMG